MKSRHCFESSDWSPGSISDHGNSLLAVASSADRSVHFKILDFSSLYGVSYKFEEVYSLIEILRQKWFVVPAYKADCERRMLSDIFPSPSLCLAKYNPRESVRWVKGKLGGYGLLLIAFGSCIFMFTVSKDDCAPLFCLVACDDTDSIDEISAHLTDDSVVSITVTSVRNPPNIWDVDIHEQTIQTETRLVVSGCRVRSINRELGRLKQPDSAVLSSVLSPNRVDLFTAMRTRKGIEIHAEPSDSAPTTIDGTLHLLCQKLHNYQESAVLDIARRLATLYDPASSSVVSPSVLPGHDALDSLLHRLTPSESILSEFNRLDQALRNRLAFGLHHMYCQVDSIARSAKNLRLKERAEILALINGHAYTDEIACFECGFIGALEFVGYKLYCVCHRGGHRIPVCMKNIEALRFGDTTQISECCWCFSVYNTDSTSRFGICDICRIGIVSPV